MPIDARVLELVEDVFEVGTPRLDRGREGGDAVAVDLEAAPGVDARTIAVAQVAERDDVAVSFDEVLRRADDERAAVGGIGLRVELREERPPLTGVGVEQDDRLVLAQRCADVGDRCRAAALEIEARDVGDDHRSGAEPVVAVPLGGVDVDSGGVGGHRGRIEVHAPPGRGRAVGEP